MAEEDKLRSRIDQFAEDCANINNLISNVREADPDVMVAIVQSLEDLRASILKKFIEEGHAILHGPNEIKMDRSTYKPVPFAMENVPAKRTTSFGSPITETVETMPLHPFHFGLDPWAEQPNGFITGYNNHTNFTRCCTLAGS